MVRYVSGPSISRLTWLPGTGLPPAARLMAQVTDCSARIICMSVLGAEAQRPLMRPERTQHESDVFVERNSQLLGAAHHVFPADTPGKRLVLELLLDAGDFEVLETAGRTNQSAGHQEACELVDRKERLCHGRVAGNAAVCGVPQDRALHAFGESLCCQQANAFSRVTFRGRMLAVGKPLVVEIMQQPHEPPCIGILTRSLG